MFRKSLMVVALAASVPVSAQQPAVPAAPSLGGAPVPGLCLMSREAVFSNAAVGKAAAARLQQLAQAAQAEIATERTSIENDVKSFQAESAKLTPAQRTQREQMLQPRVLAIQTKAQIRSREIEATREKVMATIGGYAQPVIAQLYTQRRCGLIIDRSTALGGNMANDLTADVVKGLDAKITTITFNRETLPAQQPVTAR